MTTLLWLPPRRHLAALAQAVPALRHWIAFGTRLPDAAAGTQALLATAFADLPQPLPTAALTRAVDAPQDCAGRWLRADPCHLRVEISGVRMLACGAMSLSQAEADVLADALRPLFEDVGWRLHAAHPERWYVQPDPAHAALGGDAPEQVLGAYIDAALPVGDAGRATRVCLNELQMALHEHRLNRDRAARGLMPVNSLWLHGDGERPQRIAAGIAQACSPDPLVRALTLHAGAELTDDFDPAIATLIDARSGEASACAAAAKLLATHSAVELCLESGERFRYAPWHRLRFWRREPA